VHGIVGGWACPLQSRFMPRSPGIHGSGRLRPNLETHPAVFSDQKITGPTSFKHSSTASGPSSQELIAKDSTSTALRAGVEWWGRKTTTRRLVSGGGVAAGRSRVRATDRCPASADCGLARRGAAGRRLQQLR